jgi:hypothetical protein
MHHIPREILEEIDRHSQDAGAMVRALLSGLSLPDDSAGTVKPPTKNITFVGGNGIVEIEAPIFAKTVPVFGPDARRIPISGECTSVEIPVRIKD